MAEDRGDNWWFLVNMVLRLGVAENEAKVDYCPLNNDSDIWG